MTTLGSGIARFLFGVLLASFVVALSANEVWAQKPPWTVEDVKTSGKALSPKGSEDSVFGGDGKEAKVFLYMTVKYDKAPAVNSIRVAQVLDKKKKVTGQLFNFMIDKDDKKSVTLIFKNTNPWEGVDELFLKASNHTELLEKKEPPKK